MCEGALFCLEVGVKAYFQYKSRNNEPHDSLTYHASSMRGRGAAQIQGGGKILGACGKFRVFPTRKAAQRAAGETGTVLRHYAYQ